MHARQAIGFQRCTLDARSMHATMHATMHARENTGISRNFEFNLKEEKLLLFNGSFLKCRIRFETLCFYERAS